MKTKLSILVFFSSFQYSFSQNVGIGTATPAEKLEVIGTVKMNSLTIVNGGSVLNI